MRFKAGDHICQLYSTIDELAPLVAEYMAEGLRQNERCWYVASGSEEAAVRAALRSVGVDVDAHVARGALRLVAAADAYLVRGRFDPETTVDVFNDAIEESLVAGFDGFRAAAEMSWALDADGTVERLMTYEALLRSLFSTCRVVGLCLYNRQAMPLHVIDGALATHPIVGLNGQYCANAYYDASVRTNG
jgi:hypothetical protein